METSILLAEDLDLLIQAIRGSGYQLFGPTLIDRAIVYDEIQTSENLPRGWTDEQEKGTYRLKPRGDDAYFGYVVGPHSWKKYLQLPRRLVWRAQKADNSLRIEAAEEDVAPMAFIGVRSCELHAIGIQDRVFIGGEYQNQSYGRRRENTLLVAVNCTQAASTCFCTSMHTGPKVELPSDIEMTEILSATEHYFLIRSGSEVGAAILAGLPLKRAKARHNRAEETAIANAVEQMEQGPRSFESADIKALLYRNYESAAWDEVADRCLSCANCTMVCPTCFCSTVEDTTDLDGDNAERWERWDSCFTADFSYLSGGVVRADTRSRYRQWMTHKLATWYDQFGSSGCVGCGRCIAWCPVGIDITEEVQRIRATEQP